MKILLLSMPDSFEHMPTVAVRMPNGGLSSIAGNVDAHHQVAIADLVLVQKEVREVLARLMREFDPDLVGLSVMTFQRRTAGRIIELLRSWKPGLSIVAGGYDPSLATDAYEGMPLDFVVRGEGDLTFRELVRALEKGGGFDRICGLSYRDGAQWRHNPDRAVRGLEDGEVRPPNRAARVLKGYTLLGRPVDVVETSRGCTYECSFCSIIEIRGRNFHTYSFQRVLDDIRDAGTGAPAQLPVDDNIMLTVRRFEGCAPRIIDADRIGSTICPSHDFADRDAWRKVAPLMRQAGLPCLSGNREHSRERSQRLTRRQEQHRTG
jgi:radical SAM superfamily enzyme YgiQ (UPF0313 family)